MTADPQSKLLIEAAKKGESMALDQLMREHLPGLRAFVRLRASPVIRAKESCSDLVQTVCREALGDLDHFEYRGEASFRNWLYKRAVNKLGNRLQHYKAEKRDPAKEIAWPGSSPGANPLSACYASICSPSHHAIKNERLEAIESAFDRLPEDYREVIVQARIVGLSHAEIAEQLERGEGAVRMLLSRALIRLAKLVEEELGRSP
jgi:RNA polymerase sigma-70 factor (ECF subfamily)